MSQRSAVAYRFMICELGDISAPGNADDIQNLNTFPLPNGAYCYVTSRRAAYVLDKFSDASADGAQVFAPIAGPGRWLLLTTSSAGSPPVMAYNTAAALNSVVPDGAWHQSVDANFIAGEGQEQARWSFTASGCVLTWNGPATPMLVLMTAEIMVGNADAARVVSGFVSLNNEAPSIENGGTEGITSVVFNHADSGQILATNRFIGAVANGSTLRPKFATAIGASSLQIASMQLIAMPL